NTLQESNPYVFPVLGIMGTAILVVLFIIFFLFAYGLRLVQRNNKELWRQAYHDALTGAKNLFYFREEVGKLLENVGDFSVVALNIHQFKFINEIFGREYGDRLLIEIKEVLEQGMKEGEFFA